MKKEFPDHTIIASILRNDINIPFAEWTEKVEQPIQPFLKEISKMVLRTSSNLSKASPYKPGKEGKSERQCLIRCRWNYDHPKLIVEAKKNKLSVILQLGDYHNKWNNYIFWGLNWWGAWDNSKPVHRLFKKVKGDAYLNEVESTQGASGVALRIIARKYTSSQVLNLSQDINGLIIEDIEKIVHELDSQFS